MNGISPTAKLGKHSSRRFFGIFLGFVFLLGVASAEEWNFNGICNNTYHDFEVVHNFSPGDILRLETTSDYRGRYIEAHVLDQDNQLFDLYSVEDVLDYYEEYVNGKARQYLVLWPISKIKIRIYETCHRTYYQVNFHADISKTSALSPPDPVAQKIVLDFSQLNSSFLSTRFPGEIPSIQNNIYQIMQNHFAPYNIELYRSDEALPPAPYSIIHFSNSPSDVGQYVSYIRDRYGNINPSDEGTIFLPRFQTFTATSSEFSLMLANTGSLVAGGLLGLISSQNETSMPIDNTDLMVESFTIPDLTTEKSFKVSNWFLSAIGNYSQNAPDILYRSVGANPNEPPAPSFGCYDSDGGFNNNQMGTVTVGSTPYADYCLSRFFQVEYACNAQSQMMSETIACACSNGACEEPIFSDSDNGFAINQAGVVQMQIPSLNKTATYRDTCVKNQNGEYTKLLEYYIGRWWIFKGVFSSVVQCQGGFCSQGSCPTKNYTKRVNTSRNPTSCVDSDNHNDFYTAGQVTLTLENGETQTIPDSCNNNTLTESECISGSFATETYECPQGCGNNKCSYVPPPPQCHDSDGGNNPEIAGLVNNQFLDECSTSRQIREYYCDNQTSLVKQQIHNCVAGCNSAEHKCNPSPPFCKDFDFGNVPSVGSWVGYNIQPASKAPFYLYADFAHDHCSGAYLVEMTCTGANPVEELIPCEFGCEEDQLGVGRCKDPPAQGNPNPNCMDTDGINQRVSGVSYSDRTENGNYATIKMDYCLNENTVKEFYCTSDNITSAEYTCEFACFDGKCNPPVPSACIDSDGGIKQYQPGNTQFDLDWTPTNGFVYQQSNMDQCVNEQQLNEQFCNGDSPQTTLIDCGAEGCLLDHCINAGLPPCMGENCPSLSKIGQSIPTQSGLPSGNSKEIIEVPSEKKTTEITQEEQKQNPENNEMGITGKAIGDVVEDQTSPILWIAIGATFSLAIITAYILSHPIKGVK